MKYSENGSRFKYYCDWEDKKNALYNYKRNGLLKHLLPLNVVHTENKILQSVLSFFEQSLVFIMQYVDRLKHFKNYHWKNR